MTDPDHERDIVRVRLTRGQMETMAWLEGMHTYGPGARPIRLATTWAGGRCVVEDFVEELRVTTRERRSPWGRAPSAEERRDLRAELSLLRRLEGVLATTTEDNA